MLKNRPLRSSLHDDLILDPLLHAKPMFHVEHWLSGVQRLRPLGRCGRSCVRPGSPWQPGTLRRGPGVGLAMLLAAVGAPLTGTAGSAGGQHLCRCCSRRPCRCGPPPVPRARGPGHRAAARRPLAAARVRPCGAAALPGRRRASFPASVPAQRIPPHVGRHATLLWLPLVIFPSWAFSLRSRPSAARIILLAHAYGVLAEEGSW